MSDEVLRSYPARVTGARGLRLGRRRRPRLRNIFLAVLIGAPCLALWATRDSHDMGSVIPRDQKFSVLFPDLIEGRLQLADTALWDALPGEHEWLAFREQLHNNFGLPSWLLNNIVAGAVHVSGRDVEDFHDAILVTRMTRFGTLLEHFRGWSDVIEDDWAGGLDLRRVKDAPLYYAVRGRVLVASRDRQSLIRSLVLSDEESLGELQLGEMIEAAGPVLFETRVRPGALPFAEGIADAAEARGWLEPGLARFVVALRLTQGAREIYAPLLSNAKPVPLPPALPGSLSLSADLGRPVAESVQEIGKILGAEINLAESLTGVLDEECRPVAATLIGDGLGELGDSWSVAYRGVNPQAFLPLPRIAAAFECDPAWANAWLRSVPSRPETVEAWRSWPQWSDERSYLHVPMIGGPDLEPTLTINSGRLLMLTSRRDADASLPLTTEGAQEVRGNLMLRVEPQSILDDLQLVAAELASMGLIRDQTPESLPALFTPWKHMARVTPAATLLLSHENGIVSMDLRLELAEARPGDAGPQSAVD